ncbi:MAG: FG-GAP repeat protein [Anaerolineales bacterium]|nr:FG-GAP repeat protein [Anaerolineales bacterium]
MQQSMSQRSFLKRNIVFLASILFISLFLGSTQIPAKEPVYAQSTGTLLTIIADDLQAEDWYGYSIVNEGQTIVISARYGDGETVDSGAVYVFENNRRLGWIQTAKLTAEDGDSQDSYGSSVAIDGNILVVGAYKDNYTGTGSGSVYVYEKTGRGQSATWDQVGHFAGSNTKAVDQFGVDVAIDNGTIAVGALLNDAAGLDAGIVYLFQHDGNDWEEVAKLLATDTTAGDRFGRTIVIDGTTLAVAAVYNDDHGSKSGSAYIFEQDPINPKQWHEVTKLTASDAQAEDQFGNSLDLDRSVLVVGARYGDSEAIDSGAAYVYQQTSTTSWEEVAKLVAPEPAANASFGWDTAVYGNHILVGAPDHPNADFTKTGAVYLYHRDEGGADKWGLVNTFTSPNPGYWDGFGFEVEIGQYNALIGSLNDDDIATDAGMAYLYPLDHSSSR